MIHTIKVTITVYVFSMFCYSVWYLLQYYDVLGLSMPNEWIGSLCYLPHGARVLMFCFFRYYSLPGLYLAEITGPSLIHHEDYMNGWSIAAVASLLSVVSAVELVKWTRATPGFFSFFKEVNFENYKFGKRWEEGSPIKNDVPLRKEDLKEASAQCSKTSRSVKST